MTDTCPDCGTTPTNARLHAAWHTQLEARLTLLEAHSENLIERTYRLEERPDVTEFEADE